MRKRDLTNKDIYRIGDKALNALRLPKEEIETIIRSPQLFDSIKAELESGQVQYQPQRSIIGWQNFSESRLQKGLATCGVFVLLTAGIIGVIFLEEQYDLPTTAINIQQQVPPIQVPSPEPAHVDSIEPQQYEYSRRNREHRAMRTRAMKKTFREKTEEVGEFVAVTYADDLEESKANGQVVRVKLPRASLFAMGINLPAGNEADTFKTDLLIGEDGVMRAIRLIN